MTVICILGIRQPTCCGISKEVLKLVSVLSEGCPESDFCDILFSKSQHFETKIKIIRYFPDIASVTIPNDSLT